MKPPGDISDEARVIAALCVSMRVKCLSFDHPKRAGAVDLIPEITHGLADRHELESSPDLPAGAWRYIAARLHEIADCLMIGRGDAGDSEEAKALAYRYALEARRIGAWVDGCSWWDPDAVRRPHPKETETFVFQHGLEIG